MNDLKEIKAKIDNHEKNIKIVRRNIKHEEEKLRIQLKYPRPIAPQFEFEIQEEYLKHFVKVAREEWEEKKENMQLAIQEAEKDLKNLKKLKKVETKSFQNYTG
jgi:tRNA(Phe) wybutosine-synthesizing methylase Tyw3